MFHLHAQHPRDYGYAPYFDKWVTIRLKQHIIEMFAENYSNTTHSIAWLDQLFERPYAVVTLTFI